MDHDKIIISGSEEGAYWIDLEREKKLWVYERYLITPQSFSLYESLLMVLVHHLDTPQALQTYYALETSKADFTSNYQQSTLERIIKRHNQVVEFAEFLKRLDPVFRAGEELRKVLEEVKRE